MSGNNEKWKQLDDEMSRYVILNSIFTCDSHFPLFTHTLGSDPWSDFPSKKSISFVSISKKVTRKAKNDSLVCSYK